MSSKTTYKKKQSLTNNNNKFYLIPLILVLTVLPFIMRFHRIIIPDLSAYNWAPSSGDDMDIFLYYKQLFFLLCCLIMIIIIVFKVLKGLKLPIPKILIPILVYCFLTVLSTIITPYKAAGLLHIFDQYESVFTIIGYMICIYYSCIFIRNKEDITFILKYFFISIIVLSILGLTQLSGHDIFATDFGKKLYLPTSQWNNLDSFTMVFGKNRVYLTLFNPNYVGVYVSLLIPFILCLICTEKNRNKLIIYIISFVGMVLCLIGSGSKTALITIAFVSFIMVLFFRKKIISKKKIMLPFIGTILLLGLIVVATHWQTLCNIAQIHKSVNIVTDIKTDKDLEIVYNNSLLKINYKVSDSNYNISILDKDNKPITYQTQSNIFLITDERFNGIQLKFVTYNDKVCLQVDMDNKTWYFTNQLSDNNFHIINKYGNYDIVKNAKSSLFTGYENLASGRGYIWSRTIPLLKHYIFIGAGANYYTFAFPQQDYLGLVNAGFDNQLLTKPHSLFLQIGVQSGTLALIAFLIFFITYIIWCIKLYWNSTFQDIYTRTGIAVFLAVLGFLISGISNDSSIAVSPIFWVLIGIGIAINYNLSQETHK